MNMHDEVPRYLDFCQYRKELNSNTLKAYRIDLAQFQKFIGDDYMARHKIEKFITDLHMHYKQKTVKRKIASVKAFYQYLEEEEIPPGDNLFHKIRVKFKETAVLPRIIPKTDIEHLLNHMYLLKASLTTPYIVRDLAVIEILFATRGAYTNSRTCIFGISIWSVAPSGFLGKAARNGIFRSLSNNPPTI